MKRKIAIGSVLCASLVLSACGKESDFKSAINQKIKEEYACIHIGETGSFFGITDFPSEAYEKYQKENADFVVRKKEDGEWVKNDRNYDQEKEARLNALVKAGLLSKTEKTEPAINGYSKEPISNASFMVELYSLTKEGEEVNKKDHSYYGGLPLCYAQPKVDSIVNYKEATIGGESIAEVKYSYKYIDIAGWAKNKEVQESFPEIQKTLDKKENTHIVGLEKTNNGWQTGL